MHKFNELMSSKITGLHFARSIFIASLAVFIFTGITAAIIAEDNNYSLNTLGLPTKALTAYVTRSNDTRSCAGDKSFEDYYLEGIKDKRVSYDRFSSDSIIYSDGAPTCSKTQFVCDSGLRLDCNEDKSSYRWNCYKYSVKRISYSHDREIQKKLQVNCTVKKKTLKAECSTTEAGKCIAGEPVRLKTTSTGPTWTCEGQGSGANAYCSMQKVNGYCAKIKNTCKYGTFANQGETPTTWTWTCNGIYSGNDTSCSIKK